jgi:oligopeptidase B
MRHSTLPFLKFACLAMLFSACNQNNSTVSQSTDMVSTSLFHADKYAAPSATVQPKELTDPGGQKRFDPYYWLNERENPLVIAYLESENQYFDSLMKPVAALKAKLFDEMVARVKQDDNSVPYFKNGYWYYVRYETGKEYPIHARKKGSLEATEEILINVNEIAKDKEYCLVTGLNVSPDNRYLLYMTDFTGRNLFKSVVLDLQTGKTLPDSFDSAFGSSAWMNDSKHIIYDTKDAVTLRPDKVWRHELGVKAAKDVLLYHEKDVTLNTSVSKSKSDQYIFVNLGYTQNEESHFLDATDSKANFQVIKPRSKDFYYNVEHFQDKFLVRTNWNAPNFRLMETPVGKPAQENWKDLLPHNENILFAGLEVFKDFLALELRENGLKKIKIIQWTNKNEHFIDFGEPTYDAYFDQNPEFNSNTLRFAFSSLKTPNTIFDYDMNTRQKTTKKTEPVLGGFDSNTYETEFVWAQARDGVKVPVSLVHKKGLLRNGKAPCHLIGYGSYGANYDAGFNKTNISLLDRGFVVAIAHIRGGMEMGYKWYEDGKMLKKMNTFYDFIDCAEMLCNEKYTSSDRLFASGRSAGGLLMGAVTNLRPDLFKGIIAGVPFMDVLTTMGDASIPLTTGEYTEWGNPSNKNEYEYMAKYSPYDNISAQKYPNIMVTTSLGDSQVQYFEPAKYVAKMRTLKQGNNMLIFKTNMTGSHGGSSGRFERLKERAQEYAWMMGLLGITDEKKELLK